jgi:hypothetical protein
MLPMRKSASAQRSSARAHCFRGDEVLRPSIGSDVLMQVLHTSAQQTGALAELDPRVLVVQRLGTWNYCMQLYA